MSPMAPVAVQTKAWQLVKRLPPKVSVAGKHPRQLSSRATEVWETAYARPIRLGLHCRQLGGGRIETRIAKAADVISPLITRSVVRYDTMAYFVRGG